MLVSIHIRETSRMARKRYVNMNAAATINSLKDVRKWQKERKTKVKDLSFTVSQSEKKELEFLLNNREKTTITWIGHSTFLLQTAGLNIVTDPVWASRMGFARRLTEPGLAIRELPEIDVILLSHGHYDHLHYSSLRALPGRPQLLVPEGLGGTIKRKGFAAVRELPWWGSMEIGGAAFHFVPAQHWTRRTLWDTNTSHWGGWVIQGVEGAAATNVGVAGHARYDSTGRTGDDGDLADGNGSTNTIYFAGDSGYFEGFKQIGERFGKLHYVLMPIGAYEPEWFMSMQHVTPEEAVQAFMDVKGEVFIPMHYGAFRLADDTADEALQRLYLEWKRIGLEESRLQSLLLGETLIT
ncbi:MBL fold metallo-hydrolase [Paenibacillus eucommiae]|uniref:L-ascorbate metabolism protein UlaG (Beta-lactamase superfamily) n=1 Tax=Paenibacillus eucommiae TaxID=1355755 RepID=A0ABS4IXZ1_9BACL|nr:MBL fold metallo-hydrolase [Paenibacillus eucommiae]MBP1992454.1 L-ascorbate metabolism protein UlaG (beta-lactamase superfamily) [Paenibacillus eucommiae]